MNTTISKSFAVRADSYFESQQIALDPSCFAFSVANYSDIPVTVANVELVAAPAPGLLGGQMAFADYRTDHRYFKGFIQINFPTGGTIRKITVLQMFDI